MARASHGPEVGEVFNNVTRRLICKYNLNSKLSNLHHFLLLPNFRFFPKWPRYQSWLWFCSEQLMNTNFIIQLKASQWVCISHVNLWYTYIVYQFYFLLKLNLKKINVLLERKQRAILPKYRRNILIGIRILLTSLMWTCCCCDILLHMTLKSDVLILLR